MAGINDMAKEIAHTYGLSNAKGAELLNAFLNAIGERVKAGETVKLGKLGLMMVKHKKERNSTNPATKQKMVIAAHDALVFRPATEFKKMAPKTPVAVKAEAKAAKTK